MKYWESGMDVGFRGGLYESFAEYQTNVLEEFDKMTDEFGFTVIDASHKIEQVNQELKDVIEKFLATSN